MHNNTKMSTLISGGTSAKFPIQHRLTQKLSMFSSTYLLILGNGMCAYLLLATYCIIVTPNAEITESHSSRAT